MAAIYAPLGFELTREETRFFRDADPAGYILFRRNCDNPEQLLRLTDSSAISAAARPADPHRSRRRPRRAHASSGLAGLSGGGALRQPLSGSAVFGDRGRPFERARWR